MKSTKHGTLLGILYSSLGIGCGSFCAWWGTRGHVPSSFVLGVIFGLAGIVIGVVCNLYGCASNTVKTTKIAS